jgi:putative FmdB family regulatory protein
MPTYEYECAACGHALEAFHGINEKPLKKCPACGKRKLRRLIGAGAGLIFKGDGFYITDYRSKEYRDKAKKESGGGKDESKADGKSGGESKGASEGKGKGESSGESKPSGDSPKAKD